MPALQLLYESGPCFAFLKPAGLATHVPAPYDSAEVQVKEWLRQREGKTGNVYLGMPHRLDRPASGVLLFARHVRAAERLSRQFSERTVRKVYWACTEGIVTPEQGTWTDQLKKIYGHPRTEVVTPDDPQGRLAVLHYRTLAQTAWGSWLEIELQTGRTHQVRVQAASRGWPLLGDAFYGGTIPFGVQHEEHRLRAIALHARTLEFDHPMTRERVTVTAPLEEAWADVAAQTGIGQS